MKLAGLKLCFCVILVVYFVLVAIIYDKTISKRAVSLTSHNYSDLALRWLRERARHGSTMSTLGRHLFLNYRLKSGVHNRKLRISVWLDGPKRLLKQNPFQNCSVTNCWITHDNVSVLGADAVIIHLHRLKGPHALPQNRTRNQRWIFLSEEGPPNTFYTTRRYSLRDYNGVFNWSMTYRLDADIPVPYGRAIPVLRPRPVVLRPKLLNKSGLVAAMISNCGTSNRRLEYILKLKTYARLDLYGVCGHLKCNTYRSDCPQLKRYKFFLAFENQNCREYVTEKFWWNALQNEVVPVVMGAPREYYDLVVPPMSYIHVDDFTSPLQLAQYLLHLDTHDSEYQKYFQWKSYFKFTNEHGYFGTYANHYCRVCEALAHNSKAEKVYSNLQDYWSSERDCFSPRYKPAVFGRL